MLKNLKVTHKIALMLGAVIVPLLAATLFATVKGFNKDVNFALQEKQGNAYLAPLVALLQSVPQHQWLVEQAGVGDAVARMAVGEKEVEIDRQFTELETMQARHGEALQFTDAGLARRKRTGCDPHTVKAAWQKLKAEQATLNAADSTAQHQQLVTALRSMIAHAGDTSNLILDPDLDSYYVMDATLITLPQTIDRLGRVAGFGQRLLNAARGSQSPADLAQLNVDAALLQEADLDRLRTDLETALNEDASFYGLSESLQNNLHEPLKTYTTASADFIALLRRAARDPASVGAQQFADAAKQSRTAAGALWKVAVAELDTLLDRRAESIRATRLYTLLGVGLGLIFSGLVAFFVSRSLTQPLATLTQVARRILKGETGVRAPVLSEDEIGLLAQSFNAVVDARAKAQNTVEAENKRLQASIQELLIVVSDASDGKLGVRARVGEGALGNVGDALNLMLENVGELITNAKSASDQVAGAATEISKVAQQLEQGEQRQTQEILNTSEGVRDLNGQAQSVLQNCQAANQAAENGRRAAEAGAKAVREVISGMEKIRENTQANAKKIKRLGDRSMEIAGIVKIISDLSAKTDMLALNASIEAARAGEQGRGFTVVAEQVRTLADRTKTLTTQIEKLVADIQKETAEAVAQMETQTQEVETGAQSARAAGGTLENIVSVSTESSQLVSQINQAASQQAHRTQTVMQAVNDINDVLQASAEKVRETRSTSAQLLTLSSELNQRLSRFEIETAATV